MFNVLGVVGAFIIIALALFGLAVLIGMAVGFLNLNFTFDSVKKGKRAVKGTGKKRGRKAGAMIQPDKPWPKPEAKVRKPRTVNKEKKTRAKKAKKEVA
jgi:hypothetical protein